MDKKKDRAMKSIEVFIKKVRKIISVEKFILFGSRARGDYKEGSDIDLVIVSKDFENLRYIKRSPPFYLLWESPYDIDIICLTPKEFTQRVRERGIMRQAVKEGIEL